MTPRPNTLEDVVSLVNPGSLARRPFRSEIYLPDCGLPTFVPDREEYHFTDLHIKQGEGVMNYSRKLQDICKGGEHTGKQDKFYSAVYEAVRNAHQHGNKKDPSKKIGIAYKTTPDSFEVIVSDYGGRINANFIPFVLLHRQGLSRQVISFYQFAPSVRQLPENSGIGTYTMHMVCDEVNYYKNRNGGLSVQLIVRKNKK